MAGQHPQYNEDELGQTLGDGEGQGGLLCCSPWGHKESDTIGWLNTIGWFLKIQCHLKIIDNSLWKGWVNYSPNIGCGLELNLIGKLYFCY